MVHVIQDGTSSIVILLASCQRLCMTCTNAVCTAKSPDDGHRNCPKHVEFYSKNKCEELIHLVGFIIRIYHGARSSERQILVLILVLFASRLNYCCYY
jgi:hypothetical protein